jgi:class 3 adenylate cyclase
MQQLPTGTVTFLFTDIEGSSRRWDSQREAMAEALARHDALIRAAARAHAGYVFHTAGDAFGVAVTSPDDAIAGAIAAQRALAAEDWSAIAPGFEPLAVRMGLHTGLAELRDGDYFGPPLNRAARLMSAGHGGQVLLSLATQQLVRDRLPAGVTLRDLGGHRLKDLRFAEHIYQLVVVGLADVTTPLTTAEALPARDRALVDGRWSG